MEAQETELRSSPPEAVPVPYSVASNHKEEPAEPAEGIQQEQSQKHFAQYESSYSAKWFENVYMLQVQIHSFLPLAIKARGDLSATCSIGERRMGGLNVAITLIFDDGMEWIVKTPKLANDAARERLESEATTLLFLEKIGSLPTPRVHAYSITTENEAKTPYIIMDKVPGVTLVEAIYGGLRREGVYRTLKGLAQVRKTLLQHPFRSIGSLFPRATTDYWRVESSVSENVAQADYFVAQLNNLWGSRLDPNGYRRCYETNPAGYYIAQHHLSLLSEPIYGTPEEKIHKTIIHHYFGLVLPSYVIESNKFFMAHTDLSISNVLVDPSTGDLLGVIDWEFANTLPSQAVEHYPVFLADRARFVNRFEEFYDDPNAEFDAWRTHYTKQFTDHPETSEFNSRIDAIYDFENLLRYPNERTLSKIANALEALQAVNALTKPLPDLLWLSHLHQKSSSNPSNVKPTAVIPSYGVGSPPSSLLNPPVTPTHNTSAPPRSSPLRNEVRTCESHITEEEPDPATQGIEREMTIPSKPNHGTEDGTTSHLSIFHKPRIHSVSTDVSRAPTTISTVFESEGVRPESFSSVDPTYLTTFEEVVSKSESPQIDQENPTGNTLGHPNLAIALEVTSADISHDFLPRDTADDTNSNNHSTIAKLPQIEADTGVEKSLEQANPLIEVVETAAEPSHDVLSNVINGGVHKQPGFENHEGTLRRL